VCAICSVYANSCDSADEEHGSLTVGWRSQWNDRVLLCIVRLRAVADLLLDGASSVRDLLLVERASIVRGSEEFRSHNSSLSACFQQVYQRSSVVGSQRRGYIAGINVGGGSREELRLKVILRASGDRERAEIADRGEESRFVGGCTLRG
jgi:hypothetical protein